MDWAARAAWAGVSAGRERELASGPGERRELGRGVCWARRGKAGLARVREREKELGWAREFGLLGWSLGRDVLGFGLLF